MCFQCSFNLGVLRDELIPNNTVPEQQDTLDDIKFPIVQHTMNDNYKISPTSHDLHGTYIAMSPMQSFILKLLIISFVITLIFPPFYVSDPRYYGITIDLGHHFFMDAPSTEFKIKGLGYTDVSASIHLGKLIFLWFVEAVIGAVLMFFAKGKQKSKKL